MTANFALTPDQVKRAVDTAIRNNPAYVDILGFYGRLFDAQEKSKSRLRIEPLLIPDDVRAVKAQEKFPLIEIKDFVYDKVESANLFVAIGKLAEEANPKLAALANNGGPTKTMALPKGSPAIDAGVTAGAPATDQRGKPRDAKPDVGAYEAQ